MAAKKRSVLFEKNPAAPPPPAPESAPAAEEEPVAERSGVHERKERGGKANEEAAPAVFSSEAVEALVNDYLHSRY
jgi:hypothetical protein